ncbi:unnamed protein product, partial [Cyprideis torosa]
IPPVFSQKAYQASISEVTPRGMDVVRVWATSLDAGLNAEIEYSIIGGNEHRRFTINKKTGAVIVAEPLDYERAHEYLLHVRATDKGSPPLSNHAMVNVSIVDANDNAPVFRQSHYSAVIPEDAGIRTEVLKV